MHDAIDQIATCFSVRQQRFTRFCEVFFSLLFDHVVCIFHVVVVFPVCVVYFIYRRYLSVCS